MSENNTPLDPSEMFNETKEDGKETIMSFSDELVGLKGKYVELYIGDQYETMNYDEVSVVQNSSIFGKLVDVFDRFVVLHCLYIDKNGDIKSKNKIYINAFQIRAMSLLDGEGSLEDIFLSSKAASTVRNRIKQEGL